VAGRLRWAFRWAAGSTMSQETAQDGEDDILLSGGSVIIRYSMKGEGTGSYAWNMEELANALEVNNSAMRCGRDPSPPDSQRLRPSQR
jgi:hypothetical protein